MPTYDFKCTSCNTTGSLFCKMVERDNAFSTVKCPDCQGSVTQIYLEAPMVKTPTSLGYNGKLKVGKEEAKLPINIIDEKPGGGYKVTRIGTTDQEEGS